MHSPCRAPVSGHKEKHAQLRQAMPSGAWLCSLPTGTECPQPRRVGTVTGCTLPAVHGWHPKDDILASFQMGSLLLSLRCLECCSRGHTAKGRDRREGADSWQGNTPCFTKQLNGTLHGHTINSRVRTRPQRPPSPRPVFHPTPHCPLLRKLTPPPHHGTTSVTNTTGCPASWTSHRQHCTEPHKEQPW